MLFGGRPLEPVGGAWQVTEGGTQHTLVMQDNYLSYSNFDIINKKFIRTFGGKFEISGDQLHLDIEYDTRFPQLIGTHGHFPFKSENEIIYSTIADIKTPWTKTDDGNGELAGNWRISGRMQNGKINPIQRTARKTLKLLSGTRFQWMAINPETKEFFGTGGGSYSFVNGKYTENIEFFSRDSSRVGVSLSFEGSVNNDVWTHKGTNSRGEPLHEEWSREK
jgi:hypothetical protein